MNDGKGDGWPKEITSLEDVTDGTYVVIITIDHENSERDGE